MDVVDNCGNNTLTVTHNDDKSIDMVAYGRHMMKVMEKILEKKYTVLKTVLHKSTTGTA